MFIEREAYLQEYRRREMMQALEARRLAKLAQDRHSRNRFSFRRQFGRPIRVINGRIRAFVGGVAGGQ